MLGTNDFQFCHPYNDAWSAAQGITALINEIRTSSIEPGMPVPPVLVVCPPQIRSPQGSIAPKFLGAEQRCAGLAEAYRQVASGLGCHFFDAGTVTTSSKVDGVHLDRDQHLKLGNALAEVVPLILTPCDQLWLRCGPSVLACCFPIDTLYVERYYSYRIPIGDAS